MEVKLERDNGRSDEIFGVWKVPINISVASDPAVVKHRVVLKNVEEEIALEGVRSEDWVKLNAGAAGFFRVQ